MSYLSLFVLSVILTCYSRSLSCFFFLGSWLRLCLIFFLQNSGSSLREYLASSRISPLIIQSPRLTPGLSCRTSWSVLSVPHPRGFSLHETYMFPRLTHVFSCAVSVLHNSLARQLTSSTTSSYSFYLPSNQFYRSMQIWRICRVYAKMLEFLVPFMYHTNECFCLDFFVLRKLLSSSLEVFCRKTTFQWR